MNYADNTYHFRQDTSFLYYWGIDDPELAAVIDVDAGTHTVYGNDFTIDDIVWRGPQPTIAERARGPASAATGDARGPREGAGRGGAARVGASTTCRSTASTTCCSSRSWSASGRRP